MNNKERACHWQNNISQWKISGLSGAQFCKQHELDLAQFYYWKSKPAASSSKAVSDPKPSTGFAAVVVTDSPLVDESLTFTLPNGCAIVGINSGNVSLVGAILAQL
tara:strand:- start:1247 stop:1564 length:318 start_codon:yes stop_codon:yes gene_type:complete